MPHVDASYDSLVPLQIDTDDFTVRWQLDNLQINDQHIASTLGTHYIITEQNNLTAINQLDGSVKWRKSIDKYFLNSISSDDLEASDDEVTQNQPVFVNGLSIVNEHLVLHASIADQSYLLLIEQTDGALIYESSYQSLNLFETVATTDDAAIYIKTQLEDTNGLIAKSIITSQKQIDNMTISAPALIMRLYT